MISKIKEISNGFCYFQYLGKYEVLNALRQTLMNRNNPVYCLRVEKIKKYNTQSIDVPLSEIQEQFMFIYVNNDMLLKQNSKILGQFELKIANTTKDWTVIRSNSIKVIKNKKPIKFNKNLYLFMIPRGDTLELIGTIKLCQNYIVGSLFPQPKLIGGDRYEVTFQNLGIFSPKNCIQYGILKLLKCIETFNEQCRKYIKMIDNSTIEIGFNKDINFEQINSIPDIVNHVVLNMYTRYIQSDVEFCSYRVPPTSRYDYKMLLRTRNGIDPKKYLYDSIEDLKKMLVRGSRSL